jgi:tetratricopeptide (TPR) repeat protein
MSAKVPSMDLGTSPNPVNAPVPDPVETGTVSLVEEATPLSVFVSHAHNDRAFADALKRLLEGVFGDETLEVHYSTDRSAGRGTVPGGNWLNWIHDEVRSCVVAIVVLTPESLDRPWLMWEAGAASGVALGSNQGRPVIPVLYRVLPEQLPAPLVNAQSVQGGVDEDVRWMLHTIRNVLGRPGKDRVEGLAKFYVQEYSELVSEALHNRPQALTEGAVQEWCERLDRLRTERRYSEVDHLHRACVLAFTLGIDESDPVLLDQRLHRRLGELYLGAQRGEKAAVQFGLALRLAERDLFLRHQLALAFLETRSVDRAMREIERIADIDPVAIVENPEIAGLKGRAYRERWDQRGDRDDLRIARDAYADALRVNRNSHYMAVNVGELSLLLDERAMADEHYTRAEEIVRQSGEQTVWSAATLAYAAIVRGAEPEALAHLTAAGGSAVSQRELEAVRGGLRRLCQALHADSVSFDRWSGALDAGRANPVG